MSPLIFFLSTNINGQIEEDSLATEIDKLLNIELIEEEYVSSASKYDQTPEEAPSSISVVTADEIKAYGFQNLAELLNAQRGFFLTYNRMETDVGIRGFGQGENNRILLLIDGHRINPYQIDSAPLDNALSFNLANFERVEIVRGPGSTLYGSNAVYGVINLITRKNKSSYIPAISLKYGSYNTKYFGINSVKNISEDFSISFLGNYHQSDGEDLYFKEFDQLENNNGVVKDLDGSQYYGAISKINYKDLKITGLLKYNQKDIPVAPLSTEFNKDQSRYSKSSFIHIEWFTNLDFDKSIILNSYYDYQKYGSNLPFQFTATDLKYIGKNHSLGGNAQFIWDILPNNRIIIGVDYKNTFDSGYKLFSGNFVFVNDKWSYKLFSLFFQNEYQYNADLAIYVGLRRDDFIGQEVAYNPRAGIVYSPFDNHTFKFLYGRSFRAPNLMERNFDERNITRLKKNEHLESEIINSTELVWHYKINDNLKSIISLYQYNMSGLINQIEDPIDNLLQYVNIGEVKAYGLESEINYNFGIGESYLRYSYQFARDKFESELVNSPEHIIKFGTNTKLTSFLNGSIEVSYETKRKTIYDEYSEPIFLSNVNLFTEPLLEYFTISLAINNLLNTTIKHPAGYDLVQRSIIQQYRNYLFSVSFEF